MDIINIFVYKGEFFCFILSICMVLLKQMGTYGIEICRTSQIIILITLTLTLHQKNFLFSDMDPIDYNYMSIIPHHEQSELMYMLIKGVCSVFTSLHSWPGKDFSLKPR